MKLYWGRDTGPWGMVSRRNMARNDLGGRRFAARLTLDSQSGVVFSAAVLGWKSIVIGFYPNHAKAGCVTGVGIVLSAGEEPPTPVHRCWARKLDYALGPDPAKMRVVEAV